MLKSLTKFLQKLITTETVTYVFFGLCTTVVNLSAFKLLDGNRGGNWYLISNALAWSIAVAFAYITNKLWVFESKSFRADVLKKEIPGFLLARILSFILEEGGLYVFVSLLHFEKYSFSFVWMANGIPHDFTLGGKMIAKLIIAVFVVIMNYFFSKLLIFKKSR